MTDDDDRLHEFKMHLGTGVMAIQDVWDDELTDALVALREAVLYFCQVMADKGVPYAIVGGVVGSVVVGAALEDQE